MATQCLPAVPPVPTFVEEPYTYEPPPYNYVRLGKVVYAETRDLTKKYRVIVLPDDDEWYQNLGDTRSVVDILENVAPRCGAQFLSICLTSPNPKKTFDPWDKDFRDDDDEEVSVFLEGNGWRAPEDVVEKLLAVLRLDKSAIQERYPATDVMT